ncbi:uncharacterized protein LOC111783587 [Cucurbita pepo subsp. pepo]|uniref:uncharacterized protein LOC111783587 n=1 Tax=Cucurbita pepo subsp. pepo TaxID=3664 RepID=UPI000C9D56BA|nr:uncharacterized protein LOC111783587 [Cucurbita pepo subsp. pepo]
MASTEELNVECFVMGLRPDIRGAVSAHDPPDYATTLRLAETLDVKEYPTEDTQTHPNTSVDQKRKREQTSPTSSKVSWHQAKTNLNQELRQPKACPQNTLRDRPHCSNCGRRHPGQCRFKNRVCFNCHQEGHVVAYCTQGRAASTDRPPGNQLTSNLRPAPQQGRMYATTRQEAENSNTTVTSTLSIPWYYARVLFDFGSTHSFISTNLVKHARVEVEPLGYGLSVGTLAGVSMEAFERVKDCQLCVSNHMMDVTLIVLDMANFDVILGMEWLAKNHASIDCFNKEVVFRPPGQPSFKFKGTRAGTVSRIVSALKARKMLSQGAWGILAHVVELG